ncbi:hypothetical protein NKH77_25350 [Streptomyces sp. M19]
MNGCAGQIPRCSGRALLAEPHGERLGARPGLLRQALRLAVPAGSAGLGARRRTRPGRLCHRLHRRRADRRPRLAPSPDLRIPVLWTTYFAADSADEVAGRAQERGGTVAVGPISFGRGRVAWAADPLGAAFGIWEGDLSSSWWSDRRAGAPVWLELRTDDAFAAALYYGAVFNWDSQDKSRCDVRYEHDRVILDIDGQSVASISGGAAEGAPEPHVRPAGTCTSAWTTPGPPVSARGRSAGRSSSRPPTPLRARRDAA